MAYLIGEALVLAACARSGDTTDAGATFRPLASGEPMPEYAIPTLEGDSIRVGGTARQPVTILNVWATWCTSCQEEMADLEALHRDFGRRGPGVRVIGISVDGGDGVRVRRFVEAERLSFPIAHDPAQRVQVLYQVSGVPETFIVGHDGRLLWRHVGNLHPVIDSVRSSVRRALADVDSVDAHPPGGS